jgi:hypothetical protein
VREIQELQWKDYETYNCADVRFLTILAALRFSFSVIGRSPSASSRGFLTESGLAVVALDLRLSVMVEV